MEDLRTWRPPQGTKVICKGGVVCAEFFKERRTWVDITKLDQATLRQRIATDGHAPDRFRALTVRNLDAWYAAFDVQPDQRLFLPPERRVRVW